MLTALRREVREALDAADTSRPPALRRAGRAEALLATDLPETASEDAVARFSALLTRRGWQVTRQGAWLLLDHPIEPPAIEGEIPPGELGCCASLLSRHPGPDAPAERIRALAKAAEAGQAERLCGAWHREFAAMLRRGEELPGGLLPYLYAAAREGKT